MLKWEYGMHKLVGLQLFCIGTPTFSSGTPTFCQMGVLNSCLQNSSESSEHDKNPAAIPQKQVKSELILSIFCFTVEYIARDIDWKLFQYILQNIIKQKFTFDLFMLRTF